MTNTDLFLSYARRDDEPFVQKLHADLLRLGYTAWYDRENMTADGSPFTQAIGDAIRACTHFLFIVGPGSVASKYCRGELDRALRECKVIIPILRLGDYPLIPPEIADFHAIDCREDAHYNDRINELDRLLKHTVRPLVDMPNVPKLPTVTLPRLNYLNPLKEAIQTGDPLVVTSRQEVAHLVGVGGIGKTTLASLLCHDCGVRRTFTQIFGINAGPNRKTQAHVADLMRSAVNGDPRDFDSYDNARTAFARHLVGQKTLIILDDVWAHDIAKGFLFSGVDCRLVVTTRQKRLSDLLGVAVKDVPVDKLDAEDAKHLLLRLAGRDSLDQLDSILALFEGHTLAVTLAGLWLKNHPHQTGADLHRRLQRSSKFETLKLDAGDKNLNLELALRLSYDDLPSDADRQHFRAFGIFAPTGTVDVRAIGAVWRISDPDDAQDAVDVLVGAGLLEQTADGRYEAHPLLRAYARALADDHAENRMWGARHFEHYHGLHSDFDANTDENRHPTITSDFPDILTALDWGFAQADGRACDWVTALDYYVYLHNTQEMRQTLREKALVLARKLDDKGRMADALLGLGDVALMRADYDGAVTVYQQAADLYEQVGARRGRANALFGLGAVARMRGDYATAKTYYDEALGLYVAIDDFAGQLNSYISLARLATAQGDIPLAKRHYQALFALADGHEMYKNHLHTMLLRREYEALG